MKDLFRSAIRAAVTMVVPALIVGLWLGAPTSARAQVRNTYSGAECVSTDPSQANNLTRSFSRILANSRTEVVCPIVKNIFNSTSGVTVAVAANGGTSCQLQSVDVFNIDPNNIISSPTITFPGNFTNISGQELSIPQSRRGAMSVICTLQPNGTILNYLVRE